ncbi:MAG: hypothetical protein KME30_21825 [Iphinoe sp. HA4291-MV1]|jgi:hypothetical protein|nr:hypothetical protein [Iphinoe sp. HA4291-MV1]
MSSLKIENGEGGVPSRDKGHGALRKKPNSQFPIPIFIRSGVSAALATPGASAVRWGASTAGGFPDRGIWHPGFPTCSLRVSALEKQLPLA